MLHAKSRKGFEFKFQFERHFTCKPSRFLHNSEKLLQRCFSFLSIICEKCVKLIQFFMTTTLSFMIFHKILTNFMIFRLHLLFRILKSFRRVSIVVFP
jgi:hypothetical protein